VSITQSSFGPEDILTPANAVTMLRLLITLPFLAVVAGGGQPWLAFTAWTLLCVSDGFDGYLARRQGVTRSGAFLDPLADKVLVLGTLWVLVDHHQLWWAPVVVITGRELGIQGFRTYWGRRGLAVPATRAAKLKTVVQEFVVAWVLFPPTSAQRWLVVGTLWAAVALTLFSGAEYLLAGRRATRTTGALD
jgi:CDP-diacylglycerol---glycerol-3-phosphate 3-phosphatidyltransferase